MLFISPLITLRAARQTLDVIQRLRALPFALLSPLMPPTARLMPMHACFRRLRRYVMRAYSLMSPLCYACALLIFDAPSPPSITSPRRHYAVIRY